jgi:hypothetical protein
MFYHSILGLAKRDERRRDHRQAGSALAQEQELVHSGKKKEEWLMQFKRWREKKKGIIWIFQKT